MNAHRIHPDSFAIHQRQRARRTAQSGPEYSCAVEVHKRKTRLVDTLVWIVLAAGLVAAIAAGVLT